MFEIICDQCGREILDDYIKVEGYGVFCDDDCLADALLYPFSARIPPLL